MVDLAQALTLVGTLYDAAIGAREWPQALQDTASLVGSRAAFLHWSSGRAGDGLLASAHSTPELAARAVQLYLGLEALLAYEQSLPIGAVFAASEAVPLQALRDSPFCKEWGEDCPDLIAAVVERSDECSARLLVLPGNADSGGWPQGRPALSALLPHLRRALQLGQLLEQSEWRARAFGEALEQVATAAIIVDGAAQLVRANRAGLQCLLQGRVVQCEGGRLRLRDPAAEAQLQALLLAAPHQHAALEAGGVHLLTLEDGQRLMLNLLPLSNAARGGPFSRQASGAAILIADLSPDLTQRVLSAARHFAFTPAEARVVQALLGGCTIGSIARRLGIAEATVKTHLQHVFDKTDTRRQVDLVKRIADHAPLTPLQRLALMDAPLTPRALS